MHKDIIHQILAVAALAPVVELDAGLTQPSEIDLQGFNGCVLDVAAGTSGDAISGALGFTFTLQESDESGSGFADVAAKDIIGADAAVIATLDGIDLVEGAVKSVQYIGNKRYLKVVIAQVGTNTNGTPIAINAVKVNAIDNPTQ